MNRKAAIKKAHPKEAIYYLWFIGVEPSEQGRGLGSELMKRIITDAEAMNRTICLETSTLQKDEISFGSLETKFHAPDKATLNTMKEMLGKWVNILIRL